MNPKGYQPRARSQDLIVEELIDEVLVYDTERDKAHCLNSTAARVWKQCDGRSTAAQIARRLLTPPARQTSVRTHGRGTNATGPTGIEGRNREQITEQVVWLALNQLSRHNLLKESLPETRPRVSRREALKYVGIGVAVAVPVVVSITAPTAVQAGTCRPHNSSCTTGAQCCSTICSAGHCV
jgi:hypothetical protein